MRATRMVVKERPQKIQGKMTPVSEIQDRRAEKLDDLKRMKRDLGHGGLQEQCDGRATAIYECPHCVDRYRLPIITQGLYREAHCTTCHRVVQMERVR